MAEEGGERRNGRAEGKKWREKKRRKKEGRREGKKAGGNRKGFTQKREREWAWEERDSWESSLSTHALVKLANPVDITGARLCLGATKVLVRNSGSIFGLQLRCACLS